MAFLGVSSKIQQTKMLVRCQRVGDWFLFGLVWQYSSIQKNIIKVGAKSWMLTCSCHITLSLPFYTDPDSKRELSFCNGYLSLLYFWVQPYQRVNSLVVPETQILKENWQRRKKNKRGGENQDRRKKKDI